MEKDVMPHAFWEGFFVTVKIILYLWLIIILIHYVLLLSEAGS